MKAILVTDMPKNCAECLLHYDYLHCIVFENMSIDPEKFDELREGYDYTSEYCDYRPPLCPLKHLPEKKVGDDLYERYGGWTLGDEKELSYRVGFNDCLDEILGEK